MSHALKVIAQDVQDDAEGRSLGGGECKVVQVAILRGRGGVAGNNLLGIFGKGREIGTCMVR